MVDKPFVSPEQKRLNFLCPVRALRIYVDHTEVWHKSDQLLICFGGQGKGSSISKQRLSHWIVDAITFAYEAGRLGSPLDVRAHSTRSVASYVAG